MFRRFVLLSALAFLFVPVSCKKKRHKEPVKETAEEKKQKEDRLQEAKRLLAEAGYPEGKGFPKVEVYYNTDDAHKKIAAAIQEMWRKDLGVEVELRNNEWKVYLDELTNLNYQVARRGWIGDYSDPRTFLELMETDGGNNNTGWGNPDFDRLVKESDREQDQKKRMQLMSKAEKILLEELPVIPIYFYVSQNMWKPDVKGLYNNILNVHPVKQVIKGNGTGVLVMNNHTEVASLDPGTSRGVSEHRVQIGLYEGLLDYHPDTLQAIPAVAEKWEVSADGKTYTFHLRECVWSDGVPVRAQDFEYAWKRVMDPKTASDYSHLTYLIQGAEEFNKGTGTADAVGVKAKDGKTLVVQLVNPAAYFLDLMPFFIFYPERRDVIEKYGADWTKAGNLIGNGPYILKEHFTNEHILLEKNERYWDAGKVRQKLIKWLPTENRTTAFNMYEKDQCDYLDTVPLDFIDQLVKRSDYHTAAYLGTYYFSFNVTRNPFDDRRVRRAFALAIDRKRICENILKGGQQPAYSFVPPGFSERGYVSEPFTN